MGEVPRCIECILSGAGVGSASLRHIRPATTALAAQHLDRLHQAPNCLDQYPYHDDDEGDGVNGETW